MAPEEKPTNWLPVLAFIGTSGTICILILGPGLLPRFLAWLEVDLSGMDVDTIAWWLWVVLVILFSLAQFVVTSIAVRRQGSMRAELITTAKELEDKNTKLETADDSLTRAKAELEETKTEQNTADGSLKDAKTELEDTKTELEETKTELEETKTELTMVTNSLVDSDRMVSGLQTAIVKIEKDLSKTRVVAARLRSLEDKAVPENALVFNVAHCHLNRDGSFDLRIGVQNVSPCVQTISAGTLTDLRAADASNLTAIVPEKDLLNSPNGIRLHPYNLAFLRFQGKLERAKPDWWDTAPHTLLFVGKEGAAPGHVIAKREGDASQKVIFPSMQRTVPLLPSWEPPPGRPRYRPFQAVTAMPIAAVLQRNLLKVRVRFWVHSPLHWEVTAVSATEASVRTLYAQNSNLKVRAVEFVILKSALVSSVVVQGDGQEADILFTLDKASNAKQQCLVQIKGLSLTAALAGKGTCQEPVRVILPGTIPVTV